MAEVASPARRYSRKDSVLATPGKEGQLVDFGAWAGNSIAVFTSGGDSQGSSNDTEYNHGISDQRSEARTYI